MSQEPEPEIPLTSEEMPTNGLLDNLVCDSCLERNLTEPIHEQTCVNCGELYCIHHASVVDPVHCSQCVDDVQMEEHEIHKVSTHHTPAGQVSTRSRKARQITIGGLHWLFAQRKIPTLTDDQLSLAIQYHRALYESLNYERDKRRIESFHRNSGVKFSTGSTTTSNSTSTVTRKTRSIKNVKPEVAAENLAQIMQNLLKSGLSPADIKSLLLGAKK